MFSFHLWFCIHNYYPAGTGTFSLEHLKSKGFEVMVLPWLPHQIYIKVSSLLEVQQSLPPSHSCACKLIVLLPPHEGSLLAIFKARKTLPTQSWVQIKNKHSVYNGNIGYVEMSNESDTIVIVMPCQCPYDMPNQSGKKMEFDAQLAKLAGLSLEPHWLHLRWSGIHLWSS